MIICIPYLSVTPEKPASGIDVIIVTADAFVDHPSFGTALIGRYLESMGLTVGVISQPEYKSSEDFTLLGKPNMFFGVTAGNMDSMVALFTSQRKIRSSDEFSEGGMTGHRPYLPTIVYTNRLKEAYPETPVVLGGLEASLRRVSHYDYYQDKLRKSVLIDSKADLLIYGPGEPPLKELVSRLLNNELFSDIKDIRGSVVPLKGAELNRMQSVFQRLPSHSELQNNKIMFSKMTEHLYLNLNPYNAQSLLQEAAGRGIIINPPSFPISTEDLDEIYAQPFSRTAEPSYKKAIPALEVVKASIASHRGCFGGCSFCALSLHQGKIIQRRSRKSVLGEAKLLAASGVKTITDVGGPTANMYASFCGSKTTLNKCRRESCIFPNICRNLYDGQDKYMALLTDIGNIDGIKNVHISSGIRYDIALRDNTFIEKLATCFTPGHLSVAPEHIDDEILKTMRKPSNVKYEEFSSKFMQASERAENNQFLMPYFIVGHPGDSDYKTSKIASYFKRKKLKMKQIQEFYPTPMTLSTAMYYSGEDALTGEKISSEKKRSIVKKWKRQIILSQ